MMEKRIADILQKMSLKEKITLCNGADFWHSKAMEQYGIPAVTMSDGPHGVRCQKNTGDMLGVNESEPATCFPTAVASGAGWDPSLLEAEGKAIGEEGWDLESTSSATRYAGVTLNTFPRIPSWQEPWVKPG